MSRRIARLGRIHGTLPSIVVSFVLLFASVSAGQTVPHRTETTQAHSTVRLVSEFDGLVPGATQSVGLYIQLEKDWHTYWKNPGDSASATIIDYQLPKGFQASPLIYPLPRRIPIGPLTSFGYEKETLLVTEITVPEGAAAPVGEVRTIDVAAEWLVCRIECIPGVFDFSLTLPIVKERQPTPYQHLFKAARASIITDWQLRGTFERDEKMVEVALPLASSDWLFKDLFPYPNLPVTNAKPVISQVSPTDYLAQFVYERNDTARADELRFLAVLEQRESGARRGVQVIARPSGEVFWAMLGFAFLGGLILNLMPCVLPILALKLFALINARESRRKIVLSNVIYQLGILASFWVLAGLIVSLQRGGSAMGWGFQLQAPGFVVFLIALFVLLGFYFIGVFEFNTRFAGVGQRFTANSGYWGSFFTGLLAVVVSSPCTAPFMGAAMGYALSQSAASIFLTFSALGLGMGAPYLFFACFPGAAWVLPKPGPWMVKLKEFMAFPLWGTAIWLLYVLSQQLGGIAVSGVLSAILLAAAAVWCWKSFSRAPGLIGTAVLGLAAGAVLLMTWQPLQTPVSGDSNQGYWQAYSPEKMHRYREEGKPVFVNFTASWCISCQVNDATTFQSARVRSRVRARGIVMMKADWTNRNQDIGRELRKYQRIGVPLYLYYASGNAAPVILPELLTPQIFVDYTKRTAAQPESG